MIYYSHVNEDNRVEEKLLRDSKSSVLVVVAGSGERVVSLLDEASLKDIHVVDNNIEALHLIELKLTALKNLTSKDYLGFCGYNSMLKDRRLELFKALSEDLGREAFQYWKRNKPEIENGIANSGQFERFLNRIRPLILLILGRHFQKILNCKEASLNRFSLIKWRLLQLSFSKKWVYKIWGNSDPAFISKDAQIGLIPNSLDKVIKEKKASESFMMHLIFKGHLNEMDQESLPPSLQIERLESIRKRLKEGSLKVHYHESDILKWIIENKSKVETNTFFSLSDVLSFEKPIYLKEVLTLCQGKGNTAVWRTFLRNRIQGENLDYNGNGIEDFSKNESTQMYQVFATSF